MSSGVAVQNTRGMSRQVPVAQTIWTPDPRETSSSRRMSRPRSMVVTSMMERKPSARAALRSAMPRFMVAARSMNSGYICWMPADDTSTCSWDRVNPRSAASISPSTELIVAIVMPPCFAVFRACIAALWR